jgi:hypothetical protein
MLLLSAIVVFMNILMVVGQRIDKKRLSIILLFPPYFFIAYAILIVTYFNMITTSTQVQAPDIWSILLLSFYFSLIYLANLVSSVFVALVHHRIIAKNDETERFK